MSKTPLEDLIKRIHRRVVRDVAVAKEHSVTRTPRRLAQEEIAQRLMTRDTAVLREHSVKREPRRPPQKKMVQLPIVEAMQEVISGARSMGLDEFARIHQEQLNDILGVNDSPATPHIKGDDFNLG